MGQKLLPSEIIRVFTAAEYKELILASNVDVTANESSQIKAAKIKQLLDSITTGVQVTERLESPLGILVAEGIISGQRLSEIMKILRDL